MSQTRLTARTLMLASFLLVLCSCFKVRVFQNCRNPEFCFENAYDDIEDIHRTDPDRRGKSRGIHVLVYSRDDREWVNIYSPLRVVKSALDVSLGEEDREENVGYEDRCRFDRRDLDFFDEPGPGLVARIGDEDSVVLIWLE